MSHKKQFYMLCGIPGSGKSTWVDQTVGSMVAKNMVLSTDDIIQDIADRQKLTYNDVFGDVTYAFAERMMHKLASIAFERCDVVIWDQTNLSVKTRARKLARVPLCWTKIAVFFDVPENLEERLASRPGKHIPKNVIEGMKRTYTKPRIEEGFDLIIKGY